MGDVGLLRQDRVIPIAREISIYIKDVFLLGLLEINTNSKKKCGCVEE